MALRGSVVRDDAALSQPIRISISDIVLTHWHHDHVGGTPLVLRMLARLRQEDPRVQVPRVHKFVEPVSDPAFIEKCLRVPREAYVPSGPEEHAVFWPLADGQKVAVTDPDGIYLSSTLQVVYSPGHAADHAGLILEEDNILLTGDNVLGKGSTMFEDIVLYLRSIQRYSTILESRQPTRSIIHGVAPGTAENVMYPAHGPVISRGRETARRYIKHRIERDEQLLALLFCDRKDKERVMQATAYGEEILEEVCLGLRKTSAPHQWSLRELVAELYTTYPVKMYPAVARGVLLHLERLSRDPETLQGAPFPVSAPLPMSRWMTYGLRSKCISRSRPMDRLPVGEEEWLEALAERWTIAWAH